MTYSSALICQEYTVLWLPTFHDEKNKSISSVLLPGVLLTVLKSKHLSP